MQRKIFKYALSLLAILCFTLSSLQAQTCRAVAPDKVGINEAIQYTVKISEKPKKIVETNFGTFTLVNGPSTSYSSSTSWVNGKVSSTTEYSYTYVLRPSKLGEQQIAGVTFLVDGKEVKSNSLTITVTQEDQRAQQQQAQRRPSFWDFPDMSPAPQGISKDDVMLKAYASKSSPYQGEEVIITYKLYLVNQIHNFQPTKNELPSQPDLWTYTLGDPNTAITPKQENINGKIYNVYDLHKVSAFPQKTGQITITPLQLEGVVTIPSGFFGHQEQISLNSNSVTLNVKALPQTGKPDNFSGLVGTFSMKSSLTKKEIASHDATNLLITISGKGNLQLLEAPQVQFPNDFDVADPSISDKIQTTGSSVSGSRSFEYIIIPRVAGTFTIPAATFSYFDPTSHTYKTLSTEPYELNVSKGNHETTVASSYQKDIQILDQDIHFIKTKIGVLAPHRPPFFGTTLYYVLLLLPLLLFVITLFIWRKQIQSRENIVQLRHRRANKVALKRLRVAKRLLTQQQEEAFYIEISKALWGYMSDKFHIPLSELSMDTVRERLMEKGVDEESIKQFIHTLNECEFARFAPGDAAQQMSNLYNLSLEFITKIEKK